MDLAVTMHCLIVVVSSIRDVLLKTEVALYMYRMTSSRQVYASKVIVIS